MAYKLLIVEDEKEKATGIAYLTGKYNPECRPVLLAHDGREGYEKATAEQPDIIVTDIRMPEMDGLEMIRELKKAGCSAEFIVLSGYAEFSYAKKAIELGVRDFITKPVDEKELSETITRVCGEIATRRKTQDSLGKLNDDMRNYALRDFLTGGTDSRYKVGEFLKEMRVLENYSQYTCLVLAAENQEENILPVEGLILQGEQFLYSIRIGNAQTAVIIGANNFKYLTFSHRTSPDFFHLMSIQYKVSLNLTSTRFVFFIHAKSSLYNRLLDIAKTAFQKQLTSKSTVF